MRTLFAACVVLASFAGAAQAQPSAGEKVVAAMHDRYASTWYHTLTFVQKSTWYKPDGSEARVQTWYEAASFPGRLRIDIGEPSQGNGALFVNDSTIRIAGGKVTGATADPNDLLILGFDVYTQPVSRTAQVLRAQGFDLTRTHRDTWEGRPVIVVGALAGDTTSKQFWVDADRMLFVRLLDPGKGAGPVQDVRFNTYERLGGGWLAEQVQVLVGGHVVYQEDYTDARVNVKLDPALWNAATWSTARHWHTP
ncbi:MAG TPA: hypothetical protein VG818_04330 [Gemmatimonadaceae bacterium]|nr:hypothetical protein [Gemmatimonadaceae bacterium]